MAAQAAVLADIDVGEQRRKRAGENERAAVIKRATEVLSEHIDQLHQIAGALLEYETLTGDEIKQIASGGSINRPDSDSKGPLLPVGGTSIRIPCASCSRSHRAAGWK